MNKTAPSAVGGGSAGSADEERSKPFNNLSARSAQAPPKPHARRVIAPPLPCCGNTVAAILELVALHLRCAIPALSDLTLNDFDEAFARLRPQLQRAAGQRGTRSPA